MHRFEHVLIEHFVDDRARLVGARIEEHLIIGAGRLAELLGEPLKLFTDALRQFRAERDALVTGSLGRLLRLVPLLFAHESVISRSQSNSRITPSGERT